MVDLGVPIGHEQAGQPGVIVSDDEEPNDGPAGLVIVVPVTTRAAACPRTSSSTALTLGSMPVRYAKAEDVKSISDRRLVTDYGITPLPALVKLDHRVATSAVPLTDRLTAQRRPARPRRHATGGGAAGVAQVGLHLGLVGVAGQVGAARRDRRPGRTARGSRPRTRRTCSGSVRTPSHRKWLSGGVRYTPSRTGVPSRSSGLQVDAVRAGGGDAGDGAHRRRHVDQAEGVVLPPAGHTRPVDDEGDVDGFSRSTGSPCWPGGAPPAAKRELSLVKMTTVESRRPATVRAPTS